MAAMNGMYASQGTSVASQRAINEQLQIPNIILREINSSHADFILENCDLRFVCLWLMPVLPTPFAVQSSRMCPLSVSVA